MHQSLLARPPTKFQAGALSDRRIIWLSSIAGAVVILVVYLLVPPAHQSRSVLLTVLVGMGALALYLRRRDAEHARLVKELLKEFNERYDKLGSELQFAMSHRGELEKETELKFIRYFNLCAEEWLSWRAGHIDDEVWNAWRNGMKQYSKDARVMAVWDEEAKTDSYYGFDFKRVTA
jgi:hypothetical protein